ncbi:5-dehydro-2-deoxygluconokinase [Streptomyces xantholiticus]|uniref:5-dehydro-2-deoxygluconokinase n=1 Tax=Streptomyces xantholiticus TaxID=68285 RepID=UPI00167426ED|nr:5-dehydro-2-deoxygluconokinase [Streptomyces xantholiticus]GGW28924.1 5-dehydro-2-deoxygluconokinase [Streptomyces xantholiticus]
MPQPYDVITMGRIGVDLYPLRAGVPLAQVETFGKFLGGSATNVAVAAARLGRRTAVITRTGRDAFGDYLHQALGEFGVDDRWVTPVDAYPTPVAFCEIFPPDDFPLYFYRLPKAPDLEIRESELELEPIREARVFWMTGTGLCAEPSRSATLAALAHRARSGITVFDLDWRPMFWPDPQEARAYYAQALTHVTVAVGNLEECEVATGEREPHAAARALLAAGVELAVVKQGPKGVLALHRDGTQAEVPPVPVDVVNGLGAGDAFGGALCDGLLAGRELEPTMRFANAAGAIVASRLACSTAMPYAKEVEMVLAGGPLPPDPSAPPDPAAPPDTARSAVAGPGGPSAPPGAGGGARFGEGTGRGAAPCPPTAEPASDDARGEPS